MAAPKREARRNYIALVSDEPEQPRAAAVRPISRGRIRDYVLSLMAALLGRGRDAR